MQITRKGKIPVLSKNIYLYDFILPSFIEEDFKNIYIFLKYFFMLKICIKKKNKKKIIIYAITIELHHNGVNLKSQFPLKNIGQYEKRYQKCNTFV